MKNAAILGLLGVLVTACANQPPAFHRMSEKELMAYNATRPVEEQVLCTKETSTTTYIRRTRCQTVQQLVNHNIAAVMALDVMNFGRNYNAGMMRRRD